MHVITTYLVLHGNNVWTDVFFIRGLVLFLKLFGNPVTEFR